MVAHPGYQSQCCINKSSNQPILTNQLTTKDMNNIFIERVRLWLKKSAGPTFSPQIIKYCVAMKLFIVVLILSLNVSASVYSQKISLSYKNAPLREVLQSIRKQSGYNFLFNSSMLTIAKPVTVTVNEANIEETLNAIFMDQPFTYKLENKIITIRKKEEPGLFEKVKSFLKSITFSGKVVDEEGAPLPGATVKANGKATLTNSKGEFSLSGVEEGTDVVISFIGYLPVTVKASRTYMNIRLERKAGDLNEVVINKGYYTTTKELNTGNVSTVSAVDLEKNPVSDPLLALEGRVPGLFIQQTSGAPGRSVTVRLRGQNSIANGNDPLYIIDGVPFNSNPLNMTSLSTGAGGNTSPLNDLNLNDIERIEVLKDADATAIYGSRGANGVILITTKKGRSGQSKIDVNIYTGGGKPDRKLDLLNTPEYLAMRQKAFDNDKATPASYDYDVNGTWDKNRYTDWQKVLIGGTAKVTDVQAALSGGNELTQFRLSGGYRSEGTVFAGDQKSTKGNGQVTITHTSENKKFQAVFSGGYIANLYRLPSVDLANNILLPPNAPALYDANGNLNWANGTFVNPLAATLQTYKETTNNLISNLALSYQIIPGLQLKSSFGYNRNELNQLRLIPLTSVNPATLIYYSDPTLGRENDQSNSITSTWIIEPQVSYNKNIWRGKLDVLVGSTFQENAQKGLSQTGIGFSNDALIENLLGASIAVINQTTNSQYRYNALYSRISYNLEDKYILNLTGRRDGSSRFGPGKQFGNFGAIGAAWLFGKENFITQNLPFISFGKLRASIGSTGNDKLPDYQYLSTYSSYSTSYQGTNGLYPTQLTNPYYGWEKVNKIEAGIELGLLKDRINLNVSWYRNRTSNQLVGYSLPTVTGFDKIQANLPAVVQNKGIEIDLTTINFKNKNFSWESSFNIAVPRNKLVSFPNILASSYATKYAIGQSLFVNYLYQYTGINSSTGLYTFQDQNGDGNITFQKDRIPIFAGQDFYGGLNNTFKYKSWQLDVLLSFTKQTGRNFLFSVMPGIMSNQPKGILTANNLQPFSQNYGGAFYPTNSLFNSSDATITDASFIRCKNVSLAWSFPHKWQQIRFIKGGKIYMQCQNLFTITGYKGLDPETLGGGFVTLPPLRMVTAGVQFSL